jgi:hypothetical protein
MTHRHAAQLVGPNRDGLPDAEHPPPLLLAPDRSSRPHVQDSAFFWRGTPPIAAAVRDAMTAGAQE